MPLRFISQRSFQQTTIFSEVQVACISLKPSCYTAVLNDIALKQILFQNVSNVFTRRLVNPQLLKIIVVSVFASLIENKHWKMQRTLSFFTSTGRHWWHWVSHLTSLNLNYQKFNVLFSIWCEEDTDANIYGTFACYAMCIAACESTNKSLLMAWIWLVL